MSAPIRTFGRRPSSWAAAQRKAGPVENAATVLAACEEEGRGRLRARFKLGRSGCGGPFMHGFAA
jgi:hypothetical protein